MYQPILNRKYSMRLTDMYNVFGINERHFTPAQFCAEHDSDKGTKIT